MKRLMIAVISVVALMLAAGAAQAVVIDTVPVGNPGNAPDTRVGSGSLGYGPVGYNYNIGKYEVTAGQYTAFLNAVAATDTYGLYNPLMTNYDYGSYQLGCQIQRGGSSGSYTYSVGTSWANRPVNFVSWGDAARFANWLTNGQPTGVQGLSTTEDGSYYLNGATTDTALQAVTREADARYVIPTEAEWYKAAYYAPATSTYNLYATSSNTTAPGRSLADADGHNANYNSAGHPIDGTNFFTVVGEFQNSDSPYGTFDQSGNEREWMQNMFIRGGSFDNTSGSLRSTYRGAVTLPTYEIDNLGFRVALVPEPATLSLLALGGIGMLLRRRRNK